MIRKICPICDNTINAVNYCAFCRKVVKRPVLREVNYFLNERHSEGEKDCSFHNPYLEADHHGDRKTQPGPDSVRQGNTQPFGSLYQQTGQQAVKKQPEMTTQRAAQRSGSSSSNYGANYNPMSGRVGASGPVTIKPSPVPSKKKGMIVPVIMTIFIALTWVGMRADTRPSNYDTANIYDGDTGFDFDLADPSEDTDLGINELKEEDVIAGGKHCSGYEHFPVSGSDVVDDMRRFAESGNSGYIISDEYSSSDNFSFTYEGGAGNTYYDHSVAMNLLFGTSENGNEDYITLGNDTATDELHYYYAGFHEWDGCSKFLKKFMAVTEEYCNISEEESSVETILSEADASAEVKENYYNRAGIFDITVYWEDDMYYVNVTYWDPDQSDGSSL